MLEFTVYSFVYTHGLVRVVFRDAYGYRCEVFNGAGHVFQCQEIFDSAQIAEKMGQAMVSAVCGG
jgi:hypothetical protein